MHSWTHLFRRAGLGLAVLAMMATGAHAELGNPADNTVACCQLTTSLVNDVLRGRDVSGDERFFSAEGAPPNIFFLLDTSGSMQELPQVQNSKHSEFFAITLNGCENARLDADALARGWNPNHVYDIPDPGTGLGSDNGFPTLFQDSKYYGWMTWGTGSNPTPGWSGGTKETACNAQIPGGSTGNPTEYNRCLTCLSSKGYYKVPGTTGRDNTPLFNNNFIVWGRYLNFNPPKYVTARAVLKGVIKDLRRVRAGFAYFLSNAPNTYLARGQNPTCQQIINDASSFDANRASYINDINGLAFLTGTPLGRSLLNIGYYFTSDDGVYKDDNMFGFGPSPNYSYPSNFKNSQLTSGNRSVCWGCQVSSAIVITDGEPTGDGLTSTVRAKIRAKNGGPVYCPDTNPCGVGSEDGIDKGLNDDPSDPTRFSDDNNNYYLDDVAKLLYEQDLQRYTPPVVGDFNTAGKQNLITYTVGFGINSPFLQHAADVGGGLYYTANDADSLKQALLEIIANVQTRATSFSSPAASTLQVRSASATLLPRFKPARLRTAPWQGFLYRFDMGPELLLGCSPADPAAGGDLNQDGDCDDTLLLDQDGEAVIENDNGDFVKLLSPLTPAVPFWEAGSVMRPPGNTTTNWQSRRIWTIVDNTAPFGTLDYRDTPVEFTEANAHVLREYLGISLNPSGCDALASQLGEPLTPDECARLVIRWYRGADALNPDPGMRGYDRPFLLHDIFHSAPANVDPPNPRAFCSFSTQCVGTLFSGKTAMDTYALPGRPTVPAYEKYEYEAGNRDKIVLVGSNGGMLHALLNGVSNNEVDPFTGQRKYDAGTGQELWAFIPPDMLPKLYPNINKHAYFVDATAMVRDVWIDGAGSQPGDGKKQWQEYRTVAVVGTGRGGVHRFALDLTRLLGLEPTDSTSLVPDHAGDFLWMWPQPCDPLSLQVGESFSNFAPRPAPILPVALSPAADDALRTLYGPTSGSPETPHAIDVSTPGNPSAPLPARERYVVFLNGGYDASLTRGRGMAIVDIKSGHTLWSFFYGDGSNRSQNLRYPIAAGISVMDYGLASEANKGDFLSDTATVGDYGGQLWVLRFWKPGTWDTVRKRVDNWFAARSFRVANPVTPTGPDDETVRGPITYMTLNTQQQNNGKVRSYVGTGDRENLMDKGVICRLSNPRACAAQGRSLSNTLTVARGGSTTFTGRASYSGSPIGRFTSGAALTGPAGNACAGAQVSLSWVTNATTGCTNPGDCKIEYTCNGNTGNWSCRETDNDWTVLNYSIDTAPYPQRYYGVWSYGGAWAPPPTGRHFNDDAQATSFDNNLLTDADLEDVSQFDAGDGTVSGTQVSADPEEPGWFIEYAQPNERTGTTGTIVNGCVLWNSFEPSGSTGAVCSTTGTNIGRLYQASFATGVANCAVSFFDSGGSQWKRFQQKLLVAAPPEPMRQVAIGPNFLIDSVAMQGAGITDKADVAQTDTSSRSLYQIELDRRGHDCRHNKDLTPAQREAACKPH